MHTELSLIYRTIFVMDFDSLVSLILSEYLSTVLHCYELNVTYCQVVVAVREVTIKSLQAEKDKETAEKEEKEKKVDILKLAQL